MSQDLQVTTEQINDAMVFRPHGEIDLSRSPELRVQLTEVQQRKPDRLVIDLTNVPYMDSSGVATLVEAMQVSRKHGGTLVLCGMQERVRSIFEIARLDTVFTIVESPSDAIS